MKPRTLWVVLDPADGLALDVAFSALAAAREHCRGSWPGVESHIVPYAPATSRRSYPYTPKATSVAGGEVTRLDALKTEALAWATAWKAGHVAGRADAEAEALAAWRGARLRTLRYARELHAERAAAWSTEASWDTGAESDEERAEARRRMRAHRRAMDQIGLITRRSAMLRTLRYAYDLHAERSLAWSTEAAGDSDGDATYRMKARRRMMLHRRAMDRIARLIRGEPAFGKVAS